jgi:hypothetical protein
VPVEANLHSAQKNLDLLLTVLLASRRPEMTADVERAFENGCIGQAASCRPLADVSVQPLYPSSGVCAFLENVGFTEILIVLVAAAIIVAPAVFFVYLIRHTNRRM